MSVHSRIFQLWSICTKQKISKNIKSHFQGWPAKPDQSAQQPPPNSGWSSQPPGPAPPQQQQQTDALKNWDVSVNQGGKSWGGDNNQPTGQGPPPRSQGGWGGAPPPPQQQQERVYALFLIAELLKNLYYHN